MVFDTDFLPVLPSTSAMLDRLHTHVGRSIRCCPVRWHAALVSCWGASVLSPLVRVGQRNLQIAFPDKSPGTPQDIKGRLHSLGRLLAEFCLYNTVRNSSRVAGYQGFENFEAAERRGLGVLLLTAHFGGWEVGSFFHSLQGHPIRIVVRPLDNPYANALVTDYRTLHRNTVVSKQDFARGLLHAMRKNETVCVLPDTNMTPPQGVFAPFFGVQACPASGVARVALHTGAAVVPAFTIWDRDLRKYRVQFVAAFELAHTVT